MAKFEFDGIEEYAAALADIGKAAESICKMAVYDGAGIIADSVRAEYGRYDHPYAKDGDLMDHMVLSKMQNEDGFIHTKLGFPGYLKNGAPAALVARTLESGTSDDRQQKKPFVRPGVNRARTRAEAAMAAQLDKQIEQIMKK